MNDKKRMDEKYSILLQKLRVSQTGVQVLFAFLLAIPFSQRFKELEFYQEVIFIGALLAATISAVLFIAPVNHHWILSGEGLKAAIVEYATKLGQAAMSFMVLAILASVLLVVDVTFGLLPAIIIASVGLVFAIIFLYVVPLRIRKNSDTE